MPALPKAKCPRCGKTITVAAVKHKGVSRDIFPWHISRLTGDFKYCAASRLRVRPEDYII
jgi:hypothetical protein